jgi:hypothetical protein
MKLTLSDSKLLKDSVSIISDLVTEARFIVTKDSITSAGAGLVLSSATYGRRIKIGVSLL